MIPADSQCASARRFMYHKHVVLIRADDIYEASEEAAQLLYFFLNRALTVERFKLPEERDAEFEDRAVEILALLKRYRRPLPVPPPPDQSQT